MLRVLESGPNADMILLDFSKTDFVDHGSLLCMLKVLETKGSLIEWIKFFLLGRMQRVAEDGHTSDWREAKLAYDKGRCWARYCFSTI